jgi:hypothetical protein
MSKYGKRPPTPPKKGGKQAYTPTLKDAAKDFVSSLVNIPVKFDKVEFGDKEVTLAAAVFTLLGLDTLPADHDELVAELFGRVYPAGSEADLKKIEYAISAFERFQEYKKNEEFKKVNLEFIKLVRTNILG